MEKDRLVAFIISSLLKYVNGKSICFYLESVIVPAVNEVLSRLKVEHLIQVFRSTSEIIVSGMLSREGDIIFDSINCRHLRYQVTLTLSLCSFFVHRHRHYNFVWFFTFFGVLFSSSIHNKHFFLLFLSALRSTHTTLFQRNNWMQQSFEIWTKWHILCWTWNWNIFIIQQIQKAIQQRCSTRSTSARGIKEQKKWLKHVFHLIAVAVSWCINIHAYEVTHHFNTNEKENK